MGLRMRLKANFDISGFPREVQVILTALKKYGMIMADNGASMFWAAFPTAAGTTPTCMNSNRSLLRTSRWC